MSDCSKIVYLNAAAAGLAMRAIQRKAAARGATAPQRMYPCAACRGWHLTSQPIRGNARRLNRRMRQTSA